jgi:hypothetical protein
MLGGRKVVLEYDARPSEPAPPPPPPVPGGVDEALVGRARQAYLRGNAHLYDGHALDAVAAYRDSLQIYPGYVAGYRGLGLAYEEMGDAEQATQAFETYVSTVPDAHDVPMIRRRMDRLSRAR